MSINIYDDINIHVEVYISSVDDHTVHLKIKSVDVCKQVISFYHEDCDDYIHPYGDKVRCESCKKEYNISPKKLKFIAKIARFNKK